MQDDLLARLGRLRDASENVSDEAAINRAMMEIRLLRAAIGALKHECTVAQIGHAEHNHYIRLLVSAGAPRELHLRDQIKWACQQLVAMPSNHLIGERA